jgi:hypothetical protein
MKQWSIVGPLISKVCLGPPKDLFSLQIEDALRFPERFSQQFWTLPVSDEPGWLKLRFQTFVDNFSRPIFSWEHIEEIYLLAKNGTWMNESMLICAISDSMNCGREVPPPDSDTPRTAGDQFFLIALSKLLKLKLKDHASIFYPVLASETEKKKSAEKARELLDVSLFQSTRRATGFFLASYYASTSGLYQETLWLLEQSATHGMVALKIRPDLLDTEIENIIGARDLFLVIALHAWDFIVDFYDYKINAQSYQSQQLIQFLEIIQNSLSIKPLSQSISLRSSPVLQKSNLSVPDFFHDRSCFSAAVMFAYQVQEHGVLSDQAEPGLIVANILSENAQKQLQPGFPISDRSLPVREILLRLLTAETKRYLHRELYSKKGIPYNSHLNPLTSWHQDVKALSMVLIEYPNRWFCYSYDFLST